jgi:hypothetical protein
MIARCTHPSSPAFEHYKKRGITICPEWRAFKNFLADMGERPAGTTLDRINNNEGYRHGNCRWATRKAQSNNTSVNRRVVYKGESITVTELARRLGIPYERLRHRLLRSNWPVEEAISALAQPGIKRFRR